MSYVTPITDRVLSDITTPTAKGYMNVVDWVRIYENAKLTNSLVTITLPASIAFTYVTDPTIATIAGTYAMFNTLLTNIELVRLAIASLAIPNTLTVIKSDVQSFNYKDVNTWEKTLDAIWNHYGGNDLEVCPTLTEDLIILTGETKIYINCLDMDTFSVDIQGTGHLVII